MKIQVVIEATSIQEYTEAIQALAAGYTVAPTINLDAVVNTGTLKSGTVQTNAPVQATYAEAADLIENTTIAADKIEMDKPTEVKCISRKVATRLSNKIDANLDNEDKHRLLESFNIASVVGLPAEEAKAFEALMDSFIKAAKEIEQEADKPTEEAPASKTEEEAPEQTPETSKQSETTVSFVDVKARAIKHGKLPDGKADVKFVLEKLGAAKLSDIKEDQYATFMSELDILAEDASKPSSESNGKADDETQSEDSGEKEVTIEMIRAKAKELSVAGYKEEIKAVLKELGAPSLTKIPKEKYDAFYNALGNI